MPSEAIRTLRIFCDQSQPWSLLGGSPPPTSGGASSVAPSAQRTSKDHFINFFRFKMAFQQNPVECPVPYPFREIGTPFPSPFRRQFRLGPHCGHPFLATIKHMLFRGLGTSVKHLCYGF